MLFKDRRTGNIVDTRTSGLFGHSPESMPKYADQVAYGDKSYSGYVTNERKPLSGEGQKKVQDLVASNPRVRRVDTSDADSYLNKTKPKKQLTAEKIRRATKYKRQEK